MLLGILTLCGRPAPYLPLPPGEGRGEGVCESPGAFPARRRHPGRRCACPGVSRARYKLHPFRYSRFTNRCASGALVTAIFSASHSIFFPARMATFPSSTISVSRLA